ncbi:hypothetical protein [Nocardioides cremeus]|uniref:Uncharacterized protein n=1 Tax=Nocardioides cremeus TaxID=3058044 RepID=A0ABT8TMW3_9ACTN|nr:hypothetical protein [Nocardioides cremeus]MDO3395307.1 hypothetical protein [Nocardioides cremeus]
MPASPTGPAAGPAAGLAAPTAPRGVLRALRALRMGALAAVVSVAVGAHVRAETATPPTPSEIGAAQLERLMSDHRCSTTGFADGSLPGSALLRTERGQLRVVGFARGWQAHEGLLPGTLVAVCLGTRATERP